MQDPVSSQESRDAVPKFASLEEVQDRQNGIWYSTQAFSTLVHTILVAWLVQTGITTAIYAQRFGAGYQFGQAVMLASPLFELADRNMVRGKQQNIPLAALVPQEKLYAPDLSKLIQRNLPDQSRQGEKNREQQEGPTLDPSPSTLSIPFSGGGGALPSGTAQARTATGPLTPFDMVPPSNSKAKKPGEQQMLRVVMGDASVAGGGAREGLRLPAAPERVGSSVEITVDAAAAQSMEEYLRTFLSRFRRACFDVMPDKRDLGPGGQVVISLTIDRAGRITKTAAISASGNAEFDRLAQVALRQTPAYSPLPQNILDAEVTATLRIRYRAR